MKSLFSVSNKFLMAALGVASVATSSSCTAQPLHSAKSSPIGQIHNRNNAQIKAPAAIRAPRPNVLLILADDLGWSDLGCFGGEIRTPNLDALAQGGFSFTQFYNSARCSPTRASLLTGLTPHQAGVANIGPPLSNRAVTLAEVLDTAGYSTSMVGKWHLTERNTPVDRGFEEFYGMLGGFNSYFKENPDFTRLPADHPRRQYAPGQFYSTDAFADYSIDFIDQAARTPGKPWFQYLSYQAGHFPLQAPEKDIAPYEKLYAQGWDNIRAARLARQKQLGLVPKNLALPPRSNVPKNFINIQTGWADKDNPAWDALPADRRADLSRRMAVYAATIDKMDQSIGRVVARLKATGQYENTLIFFLSDNGACAEWDPFGFDKLDSPDNILHTGADLKKIGSPDSYISYGSGWANASNTPWRLYKHYAQEGGIRTPLLVSWPRGLKVKAGTHTDQPGSITDFMPTLLELAGAKYPQERNGQQLFPLQGTSLVPVFDGGRLAPRTLCMEHEGNRMVREGDWKLVALSGKTWELYNLKTDPTEMKDLSAQDAARVQKMSVDWETWAQNSEVKPKPIAKAQEVVNPQIVGKALVIRCTVTPQGKDGVILAQGGNQRGYALYLQDGKPTFAVRQNGKLFTAPAPAATQGTLQLEARLEIDGAMTLAVSGVIVARGKAPGVFAIQPQDELSIGQDTLSAVGDYASPHPLGGKIEDVKVITQP